MSSAHQHKKEPDSKTEAANNQFHILPIDGKQQDMPSQLTDNNALTGQPAVFAQPGPVILNQPSGLANVKVSSSEELEQRTAALNPSKGHP